ncbi:hypothetical protein [Scytonema sp. HK-05]|uniref:hypothetical protein n=1 Tax=Scytonema sp. HK-05 TaxID=1137095 RepID=UPI001161466E|nr:hypothetical protein [Scytonema sp. HK-05]
MANATAIAERHATRSPLACACAYASRLLRETLPQRWTHMLRLYILGSGSYSSFANFLWDV